MLEMCQGDMDRQQTKMTLDVLNERLRKGKEVKDEESDRVVGGDSGVLRSDVCAGVEG